MSANKKLETEDLTPCYVAALRILGYRFNSEAELRRTLARLREEKWLDDERFAGAYVRTRARKGIGRLRIRGELRNAGVSDEAAERALRENGDGEEERLRAAYEKLARRIDDPQKIAARLQRLGFELSAIRSYLR